MLKVNAAHLAAKTGKDSCLEVALSYGHHGGDPETLKAAIEGGHLLCVQLLWENCKPPLTADILICAAKQGQAACAAYLAPLLPDNGEMVANANGYQSAASDALASGSAASGHESDPADLSPPNGVEAAEAERPTEIQALPHRGRGRGTGLGAKRELPADALALPRRVRTRQSSALPGNPWTIQLPAKTLPAKAEDTPPAEKSWEVSQMPGYSMNGASEAERQAHVKQPSNPYMRHLVARVCDAMAHGGELMALRTLVEGGCANHMDGTTLAEGVKGGSMDCVRCASVCGEGLSVTAAYPKAQP